MTIKEVQKIKSSWLKMTDLERWNYVISQNLEVTLDNDNTTASAECSEDEDMGELLEFEKDIGNRSGVEILLQILNVDFQHR